MQHGAPPHHRRIPIHKLADRNVLNPVRLRRHNHIVHRMRPILGPQHARDGMPINVGVHNPHRQALLRKRRRQVDRHGGFPHPTLARSNGIHPGGGSRLGERNHRLRHPAAQGLPQFPALLIGHHIGSDRDLTHPRNVRHRGPGIGHQGVFHGAARNGEIYFHGNIGAGNVNGFHHVQFGDGFADLWVFHPGEGLTNI